MHQKRLASLRLTKVAFTNSLNVQVIHTPEVARVYIGSFWDQPFLHADNRALFEAEASDLIGDLQTLPDNAALRKINDLIKRARLAKGNAFLKKFLKRKSRHLNSFNKFCKNKKEFGVQNWEYFQIWPVNTLN